VNEWLFEQVNAFARATPWLHVAALGYARYGIVVFAGLLVAGWWAGRRAGDPRRVAAALAAGGSTLVAVAVNQPIVNTVRAARPYTAQPHILVLADRSSDFSFPSDHATMAGAVAVGLWFASRRIGVVAAVAALLMALTRVYIAAHYPADVAAGLLLGGTVAATLWAVAHRPLVHAVTTAAGTHVWPVITARRVSSRR